MYVYLHIKALLRLDHLELVAKLLVKLAVKLLVKPVVMLV